MPKRSNPFGDSSPLQLKTHVAQKDVDMGVEEGHNMRNVYERTRSLLFSGARQHCRSMMSEDDSTLSRSPLPAKPLLGQMTLDSCGTLFSCQQPSTIANEDMDCLPHKMTINTNNNNLPAMRHPAVQMVIDQTTGQLVRREGPSSPMGRSCHACRYGHPGGHATTAAICPCSYCDKATCGRCLHPCNGCSKSVCTLCSIINYDHSDELVFCLDCTL